MSLYDESRRGVCPRSSMHANKEDKKKQSGTHEYRLHDNKKSTVRMSSENAHAEQVDRKPDSPSDDDRDRSPRKLFRVDWRQAAESLHGFECYREDDREKETAVGQRPDDFRSFPTERHFRGAAS